MNVIPYIISVLVNIVYYIFLRIDLFTDSYHLPGVEGMVVNRRNAIDSLFHADMNGLINIEMLFMVVSIISSVMMLFGMSSSALRTVQRVSTIASTVVFVVIMIAAGNVHLTY